MADANEAPGKKFLRVLFLRALPALCVAAVLVFAADAALLQYRAATNRNAFSIVTVRPYYAVPLKDKKIEYMFDDPRDETCVNALFPHMGYSPCWYRRGHREEQMLK